MPPSAGRRRLVVRDRIVRQNGRFYAPSAVHRPSLAAGCPADDQTGYPPGARYPGAAPGAGAAAQSGPAARLTLISAPAGFGKTTLLSEWIAAAGLPAAWVSLDARDDDPLRFARYLLAALETLELGLGRGGPAWPRLAPSQAATAPQLEMVLTAVINDVSQVPDDFALVLDDYHLITADAIHTALQFLLEHLPPQMHLVITSRHRPAAGAGAPARARPTGEGRAPPTCALARRRQRTFLSADDGAAPAGRQPWPRSMPAARA